MKLHFVFALAILVKYAGSQCIDTWPNPTDPSSNVTLCDLCNGDCPSDNECTCVNGIDSCLPNVNQTCITPSTCCPSDLYYSKNDSCCIATPICVDGCAADEICDKSGVCVCDPSKYPNLTRDNFYRKVVCESTVFTVSVNKCQLQLLGYDPSSMHLRDSSNDCQFFYPDVIDGQNVISFQNEINSSWCGNSVTANDSYISFSNTLFIGIQNKTLIFVNPISFNYTCSYVRNMQTSLQLGNITTQTVILTGVNGTGSYPLTLAAYKDYDCSNPFHNNEEVVVGSDIYFGLFVTGADGNIYVLRVEQCVASPTIYRNDTNAFPLITAGCAQETVSTTILKNGVSLEALFRTSSFQFRDQDYVNIFCDVRLCENSTGTCSTCNKAKSANIATKEVQMGLNIGANYIDINNAGTHTATSWALLAGIQLAIAFIKFF